jgi:hypothetical protein
MSVVYTKHQDELGHYQVKAFKIKIPEGQEEIYSSSRLTL